MGAPTSLAALSHISDDERDALIRYLRFTSDPGEIAAILEYHARLVVAETWAQTHERTAESEEQARELQRLIGESAKELLPIARAIVDRVVEPGQIGDEPEAIH